MTQIYCRIRKEWVSEQPEEMVRQNILKHMIEEREFPPALIAVEKALHQIPHLKLADRKSIPKRRTDIIAFAKGNFQCELYPLVVVECKAVKITEKTLRQAVGYNYSIGASFLVLVNAEQLLTGWYDPVKEDYQFVNYLPSYPMLLEATKNVKSPELT